MGRSFQLRAAEQHGNYLMNKNYGASVDRVTKDNISFQVAKKSDIDNMINIIGDFYDLMKIRNAPLDKDSAPWIWISDNSLSFMLLLVNKKVCGFFIARHIDINTHLHSIFIKKEYQGNGLGGILLKEHWRDAIRNNPNIQSLTLHMHKENISAAPFYLKYNYIKILQNPLLVNETNGFGKWAQNCKEKDQWPLKKGVDLYGILIEEVRKAI
jgi:ribosomal protein S18 acetylase RimI-like enzyme